jgi:hypothetical protein
MPFDIEVQPHILSGNAEVDAEELRTTIAGALGNVMWGGTGAGLGTGPGDALALLDKNFGTRMSGDINPVARAEAGRDTTDAVLFQRNLGQLLGMLGADAPALLRPAWPPAYPALGATPRCFHVMPFRPKWANPTRDLARQVCKDVGWEYSRGDESEEQRIISGIWKDIAQASAVLVDVTGQTPNVALKLGLAHALGKRTLVIGQGKVEKHFYPALEKIQVHSYNGAPQFARFTDTLKDWLTRRRT